jgi:hypothetical protein
MFRSFITAAIAASLFSATAARADATETTPPEASTARADHDRAPRVHDKAGRSTLHIDPVLLVPVGQLGRTYGPGIGGMLGVDYLVLPTTGLTARFGYIEGLEKKQEIPGVLTVTASASYLPVLLGVKQYVTSPGKGLYLSGELGLVMANYAASASAQAGSTNASASSSTAGTQLGVGLGVGFQFAGFDLRTGVFAADVSAFSEAAQFMTTASYHFVEL